MKLLRTLSTTRLVILSVLVVALASTGAAIAVTARGGSGATPPAKPLAQAIQDALTAQEPAGVTARIQFTNHLFPSGALLGNVGSALMSGASGRLWATNDGRGRLELQSAAGDVQVVWNDKQVTIFDASSNTVYKATLPAKQQTTTPDKNTPPTLTEIESFLTQLGEQATVSGAEPSNVAGKPAYTVSVSPKHDGGLLGSAQLAWDALSGTPLRVAVYAQGASSPVLELAATDISFGPVADADVNVSPPASAKVVDLSGPTGQNGNDPNAKPVTGKADVTAAAPWAVVPDSLVGLPLKDIRLVGPADSHAVLSVYGQGLGALVVVQRQADAQGAQGNGNGSALSSLPTVSLDGVTAHELATQLGTVLTWDRNGTSFVVAGSLPASAAETAARNLK